MGEPQRPGEEAACSRATSRAGLNAAAQIGDDTLQKRTQGRVVPESFTHGSSQQRVRWFKKGLERGKMQACDTFGPGEL